MGIVGSNLIIPAGTYVYTMYPRKEHGCIKRKRTIKVNGVSKHSGEITWAGSGNYWNWCYPTKEMKEANPDFAEELEALMLAHNGYCKEAEKYGYGR